MPRRCGRAALPPDASRCECYATGVANGEGLRELARDNLAPIPEILQRAANVGGCPHNTSGGFDTKLVDALIDRKLLLDESLEYLRRSESFCVSEKTTALIARIEEQQRSSNTAPEAAAS